MLSANPDFAIPAGLSPYGKEAAEVIIEFATRNDRTYTGGCPAFETPANWRAKGEEYGLESELIVIHDGGDLAAMFNWDYEQYDLIENLGRELEKHGMYAEQCTSWYSAVYQRR